VENGSQSVSAPIDTLDMAWNEGADALQLQRSLACERAKISDLEDRLSHASIKIDSLQASLSEITNSRTWRAAAPIRRVVILARKTLGACFLLYQRPSLQPSPGLVKRGSMWCAGRDDPHYQLGLARISIGNGWYRFKLYSSDKAVNHEALIYVDYGEGYDEKNKLSFSSFGDIGSALLNVKTPIAALRLDPVRGKAEFELQGIGIRPITGLELVLFYFSHYLRRKKKLGESLPTAIKVKIEQLGGWRNLSLKSLVSHASTFETIQGHGMNEDIVMPSYTEWIENYEGVYLAARYSGMRSVSSNNVLVVIGQNISGDDLNACLAENAQSFTHVFVCVREARFSEERFPSYTLVHYPDNSQLYRYLLGATEKDTSAYYSLVTAPVKLGGYYIDALNMQVENRESILDVVYFDSDTVGVEGNRSDANFKPEWDLDLYLANQYVGPVCAFSRRVIQSAAEALTSGYSGDPIPELLLSLADRLDARRIVRIPEVQYHLRLEKTLGLDSEKNANAVDRVLVEHYLPNYNCSARHNGGYRITPALSQSEASVSIIIPTKDQVELLKQCIGSIFDVSSYQNFDIIVVDNGSTDEAALAYLSELESHSRVRVLQSPGQFNYSALNNLAVAHSAADVIVLLNNDVKVISDNWLEELLCYALLPRVGCVGAKLYYPDNTIQHAGIVIGINGVGAHCQRTENREAAGYNGRLLAPQRYSAVTGACLAVRRDLFLQVGGLNERDLAVAFNDVDLCLKLTECGYTNIWTPYAELYHFESVSRGEDKTHEQLVRTAREASYIMQRWGGLLRNDAAYNPNLTLTATNFELSTRYVTNFSFSGQTQDINPCTQPYHYESNIERANSVQRGALDLPVQSRNRAAGLSIIILTLEKFELINGLLHSLIAAADELSAKDALRIEIIVGDTGSRDPDVLNLYRELGNDIILCTGLKYHFSKCNNAMFRSHASFDTVLFLNNDIVFEDAALALSSMYDFLRADPGLGVLGAYMLYPSSNLQHGGVDLYAEGENKGLCYHSGHNAPFTAPRLGSAKEFPAVTGACLMMGASLFENCDYFDEAYEAEAQDVDLCLKAARCGLATNILYVGKIIHYENATRTKGECNQKDRARFIRKWSSYQEAMLGG
jgi:GT2 family glycosyltransferase